MVLSKACPLFVPLVEEGLWEDPVTDEIAGRYLGELIDVGIDTLILGCTHYPIIRSTATTIALTSCVCRKRAICLENFVIVSGDLLP